MRQSDKGFITLEALVAFTMLSLALVAFYQTMAGNFRSASTIDNHEIALAEAKSLLQTIGIVNEIEQGQQSGVFPSGALWSYTATRLSAPNRIDGKEPVPRYWVDLNVRHKNGSHLIDLQTAVFASP